MLDMRSIFSIAMTTDTFVLIHDLDYGPSVTNAALHVIDNLNDDIEGGLMHRRVYYRDSNGNIDEIRHERGAFTGFAPCPPQQRKFLEQFLPVYQVRDMGAAVPFDSCV